MISQLLEQRPQLASRVTNSMLPMLKSKFLRLVLRRAKMAEPMAPIKCPFSSTVTGQCSISSKAFTTPAFLLTPPWNDMILLK